MIGGIQGQHLCWSEAMTSTKDITPLEINYLPWVVRNVDGKMMMEGKVLKGDKVAVDGVQCIVLKVSLKGGKYKVALKKVNP